MEQRQTQRQVLEDLVGRGRITAEEAEVVSGAPLWQFTVRELVGYLAGLIVAAGVIQIITVVFEDASKWAVVIALYAAATAAGLASWQLSSRGNWQQRLAEVLEVAAVGFTLGATGIVLDDADMRGEWIGFTLSAMAAAWGALRCTFTRFAGTVVFSGGLPALAIVTAVLIDEDRAWVSGISMLLAALILLAAGLNGVGAPFVARAVGSLYVIIGSMTLGADLDSPAHLIPLAIGVALFAAGTSLIAPEMLVAGAFCVVAGVVMTANEWIDSEMVRGLVIVATGLAVLGVLGAQMRRTVSRPAPGAPAV